MATCGKAEREESRRIFTGPVVVAATLDNFFSVRAAIFLVLLISVVERTVFSVVKFTCGHSSVFFFPSTSPLWLDLLDTLATSSPSPNANGRPLSI